MSAGKLFDKSDIAVTKWIGGICKNQVPVIALLIILNMIHAVTTVVFADFSKKVIDGATVYKDMNYIVRFAIALFGVVFLQMTLTMLINSITVRSKARIDIILKRHLLEKITKNDYAEVTSHHSGDLQNRLFNDVSIVSEGFTSIVPNAIFFITKLVSSFIYLVVNDRIFTLFFLVGGVLVFIVTRAFRKTLKRLHKKVQETEGETRSFIQEIIINLLAVKAFGIEDKMLEQSDELQEKNFKTILKRRNFSIFANTGLGAAFNAGSVFTIAYGAWRILTGVMTYGKVTGILTIVNQVQSPFVSLSGIVPKYYSAVASAERLIEIDNMSEEISLNDNLDCNKLYEELKAISFDNISFKYDRDVVLDSTSYSIKKGDFVAIMGISGIGKSTLLKLLLGVFRVQQGNICLKTTDGDIAVDKNTRGLFSYVPQGNLVISGTIRDNLTFINDDITEQELDEAIKISCADQFIDELPLGLDTVIGEKGLGLSEGQIQRLAIARSLLAKSPVLLLDEATSALDEETEKQFLTNLKALKNITCIIVSHKRAALEICNKQIQIINGKIVEV